MLGAQASTSNFSLVVNFVDYTVSVSEFSDLVSLGATFGNNVTISDTETNLTTLLSTSDASLIAAFSNIGGLSSSSGSSSVDLSWDQYLDLTGGVFSSSIFSNLIDVQIVVNGTASELQELFSNFGTDFSNLENSVSFNVTDGAEVTLNVDQADKLDGRFNGAILISDVGSEIASMLDEAIAPTIKDISVGSGSTLELTVDQFRNLPSYNNDDVTISDTESSIQKALQYGVLDDRVVKLNVSDAGSDNALTLTAAQAQNIGHYSLEIAGSSVTSIIINDRSSAIAEYIESGSIPENLTLKFVESSNRKIELNYSESEALLHLIADNQASVTDLSATFGLDSKSIDSRLTDLESNLVIIDDEIEDLSDDISDLDSDLVIVDSEIEGLSDDVKDLDSDVVVIDNELKIFLTMSAIWIQMLLLSTTRSKSSTTKSKLLIMRSKISDDVRIWIQMLLLSQRDPSHRQRNRNY